MFCLLLKGYSGPLNSTKGDLIQNKTLAFPHFWLQNIELNDIIQMLDYFPELSK
jgi:hypothetical protein